MLDLFLYTCCYSISSLQSPSYSFPLSLFNSNGGSEPQTRDLRAQQWQHEDSPHQSRMHHHLLICSRKRWFFFFFVPIPHFQLFVTFDHVCVFTDSWHALCFEGVLSDVVLGLDSVESYEVPFNFAISLIEILASIVMGSFALA